MILLISTYRLVSTVVFRLLLRIVSAETRVKAKAEDTVNATLQITKNILTL